MASRILVSLGEDRISRLSEMAVRRGQSRSAMVREAVDRFIEGSTDADDRARRSAALEQGFGLWARSGIATDPAEYDRRRRAEWTRPWDDDYEEARAESPDLFDAEDDRQRQIHLDMIAGKYPEPKLPEA